MSAQPATGPRTRLATGGVLVVASAAAVAAQLVALYAPSGPPQPSWFPAADKLGHVVVFAVPVLLVSLTLRWYSRRTDARSGIAVVAAVFALHAVLSELAQFFFYDDRMGEAADVVADWLGIALGVGFAWLTRSHILPPGSSR